VDGQPKTFNIDLTSKSLSGGTHKIEIWAIDSKGNPSEIETRNFIVSTLKKPVLNMSEEWSKDDVKFTITDALNNPLDVSKYQYKIGEGAWTDATLAQEYLALNTTGTVKVSVKAIGVSASDESMVVEKTAKVDKQNSNVSTGASNGKITITATDTHSGIKKIEYCWSKQDIEPSESDYKTYTDAIAYTEKGKVYLKIKVEDNVGNINKISKEYNFVTLKAPVIDAKDKYVNENASVKLTDSQNNASDVSKYQIKIDNGEWQDIALNQEKKLENMTGNIKVTARAVDLYGNYGPEVTKNIIVSNVNDDTTAQGKLPETGIFGNTFVICSLIGIVGIISYRKYKLIKLK